MNLKPKLAMENYSCDKSVLEGSPLRGGGGGNNEGTQQEGDSKQIKPEEQN